MSSPSPRTKPAGSVACVSASIGERNTGDYRGEVSGKVGEVGYYLSGGGLLSDGLLPHNGFHGGNLYTKLKYAPTDRTDLTFTLGYNRGSREMGEVPLFGLSFDNDYQYLFATLAFNYAFTRDLSFDLALRSIVAGQPIIPETIGHRLFLKRCTGGGAELRRSRQAGLDSKRS